MNPYADDSFPDLVGCQLDARGVIRLTLNELSHFNTLSTQTIARLVGAVNMMDAAVQKGLTSLL
jgi:hypothetical protein